MKKYWIFVFLLFVPIVAIGAIDLNLEYPSFRGFDLNESQDLNAIVAWFYYLIVGVSGFAAFAMLVWGGIQWLSSAGSPARITDAKDRIQKALLGLLLILGSFLILQILNPDLTILKSPGLTAINLSNIQCPSPTNKGACNTLLLQRDSWERSLTASASQVCQIESASQGINAFNRDCLTGGYCDFSGGLFQINELFHCEGAFKPFSSTVDPVTRIRYCTCEIDGVGGLAKLNVCLDRDGMPRVNQQGVVSGGSPDGKKQRVAGKNMYDKQGWGAWFLSSKACNLI